MNAETISHAHLDTVEYSRSVEHFRRQLIDAGLLPDRPHQLALFDRWVDQFVAGIERPDDRITIASYARWSQRRRLASAVHTNTFRASSTRVARRYIRMALTFLEWLHQQGRKLNECTQRDIDRWFADPNTNRISAIGLLNWSKRQRRCPRHLAIPVYNSATPTEMASEDRLMLVRNLVNDEQIPLLDRVAGLVVTVYAQPVTRVSRIRRCDITRTTCSIFISIGDQRIELVLAITPMISELLDDPTTATPAPGCSPARARDARSNDMPIDHT